MGQGASSFGEIFETIAGDKMNNQYWREPTEEEKTIKDIELSIIDLNTRLKEVQSAVNTISNAIAWGVIIVIFFGSAAIWSRPSCKDGFVPTLISYNGWNCMPGYRPEK
jgi:ABC-type multidrug transport system fused ATPase/permease subunit